MILLAFIVDQISVGLSSANQAIGNIRTFTLLTYTPKLLFLPVIWIMFCNGCSLFSAMVLYVAVETVVSLIRIPYMHYKAGLHITRYVQTVVVPVAIQAGIIILICWLCKIVVSHEARFVATGLCSVAAGTISGWFIILNEQERLYTKNLITRLVKR